MRTPVFEEFDPASDCDCPGCVHRRRVSPYARARPAGFGGRPVAHRTVVIAAASAAAFGAGHAAPALAAGPQTPAQPGVPAGDEPETPQGERAPLHGPAGQESGPVGTVKAPATTRADIINRAKKWVAAKVPYSMTKYWSDGYRQDCSGYVSMAWNLPGNEWTGSLGKYGELISKQELQPGDILLFHNLANPQKGSHVVIFGGWTDYTHTYYIAYEQTPPSTRRQSTPYAYWSHSDRYLPYRYKGLRKSAGEVKEDSGESPLGGGEAAAALFPGPPSFGPGADNQHVALLGQLLVGRGGRQYYATGPGPRWTDADRRATQAFQRAQGWQGAAADGLPGPKTWALLTKGQGRDIVPGAMGPAPVGRVPAYPGRAMFRPGADNEYVTRLGRQLVKKGFGKYYTTGPGPRWGEADRRNVEAFQRAQGWRGGAADGSPGPETWRRLFS